VIAAAAAAAADLIANDRHLHRAIDGRHRRCITTSQPRDNQGSALAIGRLPTSAAATPDPSI
jgi:hypothetical protein